MKWQKLTDPVKMRSSFQSLIAMRADIGWIRDMPARLKAPPRIERQGKLKSLFVEGDYTANGGKVDFYLEFIPEGRRWKLYGIRIYVLPPKR